MKDQIELKDLPEQPVLSVRKTVSMATLQQEMGMAFKAVMEYLAELGEQPAGPVFAAYYNLDMEHLDVEMGAPVEKPRPGKGEVKAGVIPAGKQVSTIHKGAYTKMEPVYNAINAWIGEKGLTPTGVVYEHYFNSPLEVPEDELMTRIVFLMK